MKKLLRNVILVVVAIVLYPVLPEPRLLLVIAVLLVVFLRRRRRRSRNTESTGQAAPRTRTHIPAGLRNEVLRRDQGKCQYCGRSAPEVVIHFDHIVPLSKGGATTLDNLQLLCEQDNLGKSDRPDWKP